MKKHSKRKPATTPQNQHANASLYQLAFQMLVNSISETRDEDHLVRMLIQSQIG